MTVRSGDGTVQRIEADHVIAGTGYRMRLDALGFLSPSLLAGLARTGGFPQLDGGLGSSVPGLFFTGLPAAATFGPVVRFVSGTSVASPGSQQRSPRSCADVHQVGCEVEFLAADLARQMKGSREALRPVRRRPPPPKWRSLGPCVGDALCPVLSWAAIKGHAVRRRWVRPARSGPSGQAGSAPGDDASPAPPAGTGTGARPGPGCHGEAGGRRTAPVCVRGVCGLYRWMLWRADRPLYAGPCRGRDEPARINPHSAGFDRRW